MTLCEVCNVYETTKVSNFKRHLERCTRRQSLEDAERVHASDATQISPRDINTSRITSEFESTIDRATDRLADLRTTNAGRPRATRLTMFDTANAALEAGHVTSNGGSNDSVSDDSVTAEGMPSQSEPTLAQRPTDEAPLGVPLSTPLATPPPTKKPRRASYKPIGMSSADCDRLVARVDELEATVMRLQHALCVMDARMQQFRLAASSWKPVLGDE